MKSDAESDEQLMDLVSMVMKQPPANRESFLRQACNDPELRRKAYSIVRTEEQLGSFMLQPVSTLKETVRPFEAGQVIQERFQIIREIGQGGMGIVYEAFDQKRQIRIAIKAAKAGFQQLLSPELEGAIKVSHPNVCRVHEIHTASTSQGEVDFLTMELLQGQTLAAYMDAHSKLTHGEAVEITRQLCAGLEAAHHCNIIHRDLKSSNVMLCSNEDAGFRVVITDFGLAGDNTKSYGWGGTPRYIAPELWEGETASRASDIYALGVILLDMLSGSTGSPADSGSALTSQVEVAKRLPTHWKGIVLSCLERDPIDRPASAMAVLQVLDKRRNRRAYLMGLLLTLSLALLLPQTHRSIHDYFWPPIPNIRLAILPVEGADAVNSAPGILQDAADRISHLQSTSRTVAVFLPGKVADMQIHTPLDARNILHATHALQTTMRREGESLAVSVSLIDLETQAHIREVSYRYTAVTVVALPNALAGEISAGLGLPNAANKETLSPPATARYDQGLSLLLDGRSTEESIRLFIESSHLDPGSLIPLTALVEAEIKKFESSKDPADLSHAREYLQMAKSLNPDSVKVHVAEGKLAEATGNFEKALESYLRVKELEPNNIDAFVHVAGVYDKLDMPERAIQEYRRAIQLDPDFYEAYQYFGVFYYFRGKYSDAADQFRKVIERAPRMYRAYMNLDASLEALGRYQEAEEVLRNSFRFGSTAGTLNNMGALLACEHRDEEAVVYSHRAVELSPSDYLYRLNLADSYRRLGRVVEAQAEYRKALNSARSELTQNPRSGYVRAFVAYFSVRLGDRHRAEDEIAQALQSSPGNARVLLRAVLTYDLLGQRQEAMSILSSAPAELLREIDRDPDLADFSRDLRFKRLVAEISH